MLLYIEGLTKRFGGLTAVNNVSFEVHKGELLGIIGPNGSGKTTLFNLISGVFPPDKGKVYFKRRRIDGLPTHKICKLGLTRTFQVMQPFGNLSVFDTVMAAALNRLSMVHAEKKAESILEIVGLLERARVRSNELTGPDLKILELAKALATGAETILLDEVMAGLTFSEARNIISVIRQLQDNGEITFIIVEHVMSIVMELAKRLIVLNFGQKIAEGIPEEITKNKAVIDCYLGGEVNFA